MSKENGVADTVGNIVKHVEKQTNKDIMDFKKIVIYVSKGDFVDVKYKLEKISKNTFKDWLSSKVITDKSQIYNRLQYIRQSGYQFEDIIYSGNYIDKRYVADGDELEIELM